MDDGDWAWPGKDGDGFLGEGGEQTGRMQCSDNSLGGSESVFSAPLWLVLACSDGIFLGRMHGAAGCCRRLCWLGAWLAAGLRAGGIMDERHDANRWSRSMRGRVVLSGHVHWRN